MQVQRYEKINRWFYFRIMRRTLYAHLASLRLSKRLIKKSSISLDLEFDSRISLAFGFSCCSVVIEVEEAPLIKVFSTPLFEAQRPHCFAINGSNIVRSFSLFG